MLHQKGKKNYVIPKIRPIGITGILIDWSGDNACDIKGTLRGSIKIRGQGNRIEVMPGAVYRGHLTIIGSDNLVTIGRKCVIVAKILIKGKNQTVSIGENTTYGSGYILCQESCNVSIGHTCMISRNVEIRTSDSHSLVDRKTRQRLNRPESITIGNHVWIGVGALISKGSKIPEDSVVGAMSFVNKSFDESGIVVAGVPARIVRRGVTWHRSRKKKFSADVLNEWQKLSPQDTETRDV